MTHPKIVVIGHQGFIGSHLADHLTYSLGIDIKSSRDFRDDAQTVLCLDADVIILLAAEHLTQTRDMYTYNLSLYNALSPLRRPHIIFASSAAVYTDSLLPHVEEEECLPSTLYGKSKLLGEQIIQDVCDDYTILRFSNVFGSGEGHGVIDVFEHGGRTIYGDGSQVRDYIDVDTVCKAIAAVANNPTRYNHKIYNVSSGVGQTVNTVFKVHGRGKPIYKLPRSFDVPYSVLDNSLATIEGLL